MLNPSQICHLEIEHGPEKQKASHASHMYKYNAEFSNSTVATRMLKSNKDPLSSGRERSDQRSPMRRLYACPDQVLHQNHVRHSTFPTKNMAATFARFTQLLMIEFSYRRRSMGPMRLYLHFLKYLQNCFLK